MSKSKRHICRSERLEFNLVVDKQQAEKHQADIQTVLDKKAPECDDGDSLKLNYTLKCEYWGNVVERLEALNRILQDTDVLVKVDSKELIHKRCVIAEIVRNLDKAQAAIQARSGK